MQPAVNLNRRQNEEGSEDADEMTIPYDGLHLLECHNMTPYDTVLKLEDFLQHLQWSSVAPVVRCVCRRLCCFATCKSAHTYLCAECCKAAILTAVYIP